MKFCMYVTFLHAQTALALTAPHICTCTWHRHQLKELRTLPSRQSTQAQPAEGRPGPSDDDDDDDGDGDDDDGGSGDMIKAIWLQDRLTLTDDSITKNILIFIIIIIIIVIIHTDDDTDDKYDDESLIKVNSVALPGLFLEFNYRIKPLNASSPSGMTLMMTMMM